MRHFRPPVHVRPPVRRSKKAFSPIHGRMARRRGELVRVYRDRTGDDVDLEEWYRAMADSLVFGKEGSDYDTFTRLAQKMGITVDEDAAMDAIHAADHISKSRTC